jgi:tetratricopeptide (TPR) repeat protein
MNYSGLADVQLSSLETDEAVSSLRAALQVVGTEANGNDEHDRTVMTLSGRMGRALNELGSHLEAIANLQRAITLAEDVARRSPSRQATRNLYAFYNNIVGPLAGRETLNVGDSTRAQVYARKAVALAEDLAAGDSKNVQGKSDLAFVYTAMGDAMSSARPTIASGWYRKAIAVTREMAPRTEAQRWIASRDEALAQVLVTKEQARERLHLLQEATTLRLELAKGTPPPLDRVYLMRAYCRLSDAELALNDLVHAREHADAARPFFNDFKVTSPSLIVLRELGFCYKSLGTAYGRAAMDRTVPLVERYGAAAESQQWLQRSYEAWSDWERRGAATPASEAERQKVEGLLRRREPIQARGPSSPGGPAR